MAADPLPRQFTSDNASGICPEAWAALEEANHNHAFSYGDDDWTQRARRLIRDLFETDCEIFFVFNGTAANSLALAAMCQSYHSVVCHEIAHVETDECGAPEFFSNGTKLLTVPGDWGKVDASAVRRVATRRTDIHFPKPRVLSVSQATELGTVYHPGELAGLGDACKRLGLKLHMDGARFSNALVSLGLAPKDITWKAGVDVLCLGGTKAGMAIGDAIVFFDRSLAEEFAYRVKQAGQLASKMRFLAAPWVGMLRDNAFLKHAAHANACAKLLEKGLRALPGVKVMFPVEANSVFAELPAAVADSLKTRGYRFYSFIGVGGARFMCSWDTREDDVRRLVADIAGLVNAGAAHHGIGAAI